MLCLLLMLLPPPVFVPELALTRQIFDVKNNTSGLKTEVAVTAQPPYFVHMSTMFMGQSMTLSFSFNILISHVRDHIECYFGCLLGLYKIATASHILMMALYIHFGEMSERL